MKESWLVEYNDDKACFHFLPTGNSANSSVVDGGKLGLKTKACITCIYVSLSGINDIISKEAKVSGSSFFP